MESIWTHTARLPQFPPLERDANTQVLVIGGGMAGLLCAHELGRAGVQCLVAEAQTIAGGITKNTTAKITAQHGLIYGESAHADPEALPPYGVRPEMEPTGAELGLPLPRLPVYGKRETDRQFIHKRFAPVTRKNTSCFFPAGRL